MPTYRSGKRFDSGKPTRSGTSATGTPTPFVRAQFMPDLIYTVQASYDFGDMFTFWVNTTGQSSIVDDVGRKYPAAR